MRNYVGFHAFVGGYFRDLKIYLIWKISLIFNLNWRIKCSTFKNLMKNQNTKFDYLLNSDLSKCCDVNPGKWIYLFLRTKFVNINFQFKNFQNKDYSIENLTQIITYRNNISKYFDLGLYAPNIS